MCIYNNKHNGNKSYKQFEYGVRIDFSLQEQQQQQQQNILDSFYLSNILGKKYLSMYCFKKERSHSLLLKYVHYALHPKSREKPIIKSKQQ